MANLIPIAVRNGVTLKKAKWQPLLKELGHMLLPG
jgi:hypothetical protein